MSVRRGDPQAAPPRRAGRATQLVLLSGLLAGTVSAFADDLAGQRVRLLAAGCAACHGSDGKAVPGTGMARLAGRDAADIAAQLRAFRDGARPATVMQQLAKGYSDAQIDALARYFAAVP